MHDVDPFNTSWRQSNEAYLDTESGIFLRTVFERLRDAQSDGVSLMGRGYDIFLVTSDSSKIGNIECNRIRFTPSQVYQDRDAQVYYPGHGKIQQLVVEVPKFFQDEVPGFVFTTTLTEDGEEFHHVVSSSRILEVNPHDDDIEPFLGPGGAFILYRTSDLRGVSHYEDLQAPGATDDEISERVKVIRLLSEVVSVFKVANQSRADGTAES